ncbi:MAG TPA: adventurous gliding motility protein CglF [Myxococcales bacterium]|jgi:hypothetical protein|nr:adventurous gliding motility protein CglF [Myxococcales bacterium]
MRKLIALAAVAFAVGALPAWAEDPPAEGGGEKNVKYSKTTTINFEDDTIEGDLTKPDGEYVEARKRVKHSNLIRIREEFKDKVMESVSNL